MKTKTKPHRLRTIAIWTLVSLVLQFGFYILINNAIEKVMNPNLASATASAGPSTPPKTVTSNTVLPDTTLSNVQISYDKNYLAYMTDGVFKVFDIKNNKVVFEKKPDSSNGKDLGVLDYQWLADRNSLIYLNAKMATVTTTVSTDTGTKKPVKSAAPTHKTEDPNDTTEPAGAGYVTDTSAPAETIAPAETPEPTETPEPSTAPSASKTPSAGKTVTSVQQVTELNALDLTDNGSEAIDDKHYINLNSFPVGGKILHLASSTYTNLIYITVKSGSSVTLMEIDVMNNTRLLQQSGEIISNIATSDRFGTLFVESAVGKTKQIIAINGTKRRTVSKNSNYVILGERNGILYVGETDNSRLVKILSGTESSDNSKTPELSQIWTGDIPYSDERVLIGASGQVIIYGDKSASIIHDGKESTVSFTGEETYISSDGAEQIQLTRKDGETSVALSPLSIS